MRRPRDGGRRVALLGGQQPAVQRGGRDALVPGRVDAKHRLASGGRGRSRSCWRSAPSGRRGAAPASRRDRPPAPSAAPAGPPRRSHLLRASTSARPSLATRSASCRSCFSSGSVASISRITTSAKRIARSASPTDSFSSLPTTFALRRMPAVSTRRKVRAAPSPVHGDRVARDAGLRPGQHPLLADQAVDQRGLAGIRLADDGDLERLCFCRRSSSAASEASAPPPSLPSAWRRAIAS